MDNVSEIITKIAIWALPVLFAITVHEAAHGWVANKCGDKTALMMGRVTLNPIKHIDFIGTILVPLVFLIGGGFIFGWAKPVPVVWRNLKNMPRDGALVAAAGPISNLVMALLWALIAKIAFIVTQHGVEAFKLFVLMGMAGIQINLMLCILNLIPIPPLDGSRVVESVLPRQMALQYDSIAPYGMIILIVLMFSGMLTYILVPPYSFLQGVISFLFQI